MSSIGYAASMGVAAGLDTVEKYSYQEWLNTKQLETDELRRQRELEFRQRTLQDELDMDRQRQLAQADTEMEVWERQGTMRQKQSEEETRFSIARFRALAPEKRTAALQDKRAEAELLIELQEKYFEREQGLARSKALSDAEIQVEATKFVIDQLGIEDKDTAQRVAIKMLAGMDIDANQPSTTGGVNLNLGSTADPKTNLNNLTSALNDNLMGAVDRLVPSDTPTAASLRSGTPAKADDARKDAKRLMGNFVGAIGDLKLEDARKAVAQIEGLPGEAGRNLSDQAKRMRAFVDAFTSQDQFKRVMLPKTAEDYAYQYQFLTTNIDAFKIFEVTSNATQTVQEVEDELNQGMAAPTAEPGKYGPNYNMGEDGVTDVRGAAAEAGWLPGADVIQMMTGGR